jgi:hypothetical protein
VAAIFQRAGGAVAHLGRRGLEKSTRPPLATTHRSVQLKEVKEKGSCLPWPKLCITFLCHSGDTFAEEQMTESTHKLYPEKT